ncbi:hypothetical protein HMPREF2532_00358 [Bacteroides ovatus]|nr:hypothetical protein HMPREF2532_00358 [Bacteroides ovatus]
MGILHYILSFFFLQNIFFMKIGQYLTFLFFLYQAIPCKLPD